jgi:hypothetical protein
LEGSLLPPLIRHAAEHEARHLNGLRMQLEDSTDLPASLRGQIYEAILDGFITVLHPGKSYCPGPLDMPQASASSGR